MWGYDNLQSILAYATEVASSSYATQCLFVYIETKYINPTLLFIFCHNFIILIGIHSYHFALVISLLPFSFQPVELTSDVKKNIELNWKERINTPYPVSEVRVWLVWH